MRFNVTADVQRFIDGDPNHGWIIKGTLDPLSGNWVNFGSRESGAPPQLLLQWSFLCPLGDTDNDGVDDCSDQCARDPQKVVPGLCGCGVAETDSDGDKVPDCKDQCPNDPNNVRRGQCGCAGDADVHAYPVDTDNPRR